MMCHMVSLDFVTRAALLCAEHPWLMAFDLEILRRSSLCPEESTW